MIQYLRHSFFAARRFSSLDDLNGQLARWIRDVAHTRPLPGHQRDRLVRDALAEEQPRLLPLPEHPVACDLVRSAVSGKTPYRRYDRGQRVEAPAHLAALAREKRHAHDLRGRDRLRATCAYADALLDALARRGEPLTPHTTMLLRLLDQYGATALDWALNEALA